MRIVKGISLILRQMPWSVPFIIGLWFVAIKILKVGIKLKTLRIRILPSCGHFR
jgi:hypothetical protein